MHTGLLKWDFFIQRNSRPEQALCLGLVVISLLYEYRRPVPSHGIFRRNDGHGCSWRHMRNAASDEESISSGRSCRENTRESGNHLPGAVYDLFPVFAAFSREMSRQTSMGLRDSAGPVKVETISGIE